MIDSKDFLVRKAIALLECAGYQVSDCCMVRSCFDILARKEEKLLLIKILVNIEGLTSRSAAELKNVACALSATPLVLGDHMKSSLLSPDVIYTRYDLHVVNIEAFERILEEKPPQIYSIRGDYCVTVDSDLLSSIRRKADMTQDELAEKIGVSKQSIHRYESTGRISFEVAERLIDFLKDDLFLPKEVFSPEIRHIEERVTESATGIKRGALHDLMKLGFDASLTNAPFDIYAVSRKPEERILTVVSNDRVGLQRKVEIMSTISEITGARKVCISNRTQKLDVVVIKPKRLSEMRDRDEFFDALVD